MRQVTNRSLWIGNTGDLQNPQSLYAAGIEAIVELGDSEPFVTLARDLIRCRFPLSDGGDNSRWLIQLAIDTVAALLKAQTPMLVCCSAGMSRSVSIAAAGIAVFERLSLKESVALIVAKGPADVSPGFLAQVQDALDHPEN